MKTYKEYADKNFPTGYLKRCDEIDLALAMHLTDSRMEFEEYAQWEDGAIQGKHPTDIIGCAGVYETVYRRSKYSPFQYMVQCCAGRIKNVSPMLSRKIYVCSRYHAQNLGAMIQNMGDALAECKRIAEEGDIPICPHLYYTQFLNDDDAGQMEFGVLAAKEDLKHCDAMTVLIRNEIISKGMESEMLLAANELGIPVNIREISGAEKR